MRMIYQATLFDAEQNQVEQRDFEIAEHGASWAAAYLARMAEDGLASSVALDPIERFES
jgi:hypothetical protein